CSGLTFADLAWAACFGCPDAARSSRCRPFAAPHPADRRHRRDRRSSFPAWLRSCRSRNIATPNALRDGSPRDRERQSMAIDNRRDFHAFSALRSSDFQPATLGHDEGCVDEAFFFVQYASIAKLVGNIRQHATQNLIAAPSLKAPMHGFASLSPTPGPGGAPSVPAFRCLRLDGEAFASNYRDFLFF